MQRYLFQSGFYFKYFESDQNILYLFGNVGTGRFIEIKERKYLLIESYE